MLGNEGPVGAERSLECGATLKIREKRFEDAARELVKLSNDLKNRFSPIGQ